MADAAPEGGFGLYIHWPFCTSKCPYCDFNSHVAATIDGASWQRAYLSELDRYGQETAGRVLNSVYFGGGTPSLMDPGLVGALLDRLSAHWRFANDLEVTLEANPGSVEAERFAGYRAGGVNRLSMGFQALDDADLKALGRLHSVEEGLAALDVARAHFTRVNFDLIYARQDQSLADWEAELQRALALGPDHLSLYQLTVEPGTAFGDRFARGRLPGLPEEDLAADMYFLTQDVCEAAGLPAYEVSNHARPSEESRHNLIYWRGGDWVGIGPGAHGRLTLGGQRIATWTDLGPGDWLSKALNGGTGEAGRSRLTSRDHAGEYLMMSLRTVEGLDIARYAAIAGAPLDRARIDGLKAYALVNEESGRLTATRQGRAVLNALITELMPD